MEWNTMSIEKWGTRNSFCLQPQRSFSVIGLYILHLDLLFHTNTQIHNRSSPLLSFLTALPEDLIKMARDIKPIVEIQQKGDDFVVTSKTPRQTVTNSFTLGKEADITTMDGKKLKVMYLRNRWSSLFTLILHFLCTNEICFYHFL